ncbi:radical SAM protein [Micromonospora sp. WMMD956]|jgi:MoaA/NifB/PqqE/SkfB family radical SAM enzyme|uniref:radical SAM/SPASM domain-containing protein n=1 Tax=Micromonospora TaxID=1873 RepID=UPI002415AA35|nr:radical SAM protein [Micromonospora sp. WMMD956]MDG4814175.1 radical SAM protein [Micromonospora sp. WMMD956]
MTTQTIGDLPAELVLAPFVKLTGTRRYTDDTPRVYRRLDLWRGAKQGVAATDRITRLLGRFEHPQSTAALVLSAGSRADDLARTLATLVEVGLLVDVSAIRTPRPSLELEITNRCNADCMMCPRQELRPLGDMSEETFERFLEFAAAIEAPGIILQGIGEPTLHRQLVPWVRRMRETLGPEERFPIVAVTNGFRMDADTVAALRDAGLSLLKWSIHSLRRERFATIFGRDKRDVSVANLEAAIRVAPDLVALNFVKMDINQDEVDDFHRWIEERGLSRGRFRQIEVQGRGGTLPIMQLTSRPGAADQAHCLFRKQSLFVAWDGDLLPCSNDVGSRHRYANLTVDDTDTIMSRWRTELLGRPAEFPICAGCDHGSRGNLPTDWHALASRASLEPA